MSFVMIHLRFFVLMIAAFFTLAISASADDAIVIGGDKQSNTGNATTGSENTAIESNAIEVLENADPSVAEGEKIPLVFTLDDLVSYGIRHSPNLKRLGLDIELVTLERDATLFFTDPRLKIQGSAFYRENETTLTGGATGSTESTGVSYDLSLVKPYKSGDTFTVGHSIGYTDTDMTSGTVSDNWAQSLSASYTWQLYKDRGEDVTLYNFKLKQNSLELKPFEILDATRTLATSVASQYFTIAYLKENVRIQQETLDYYKKLLDRNSERYKVGLSLKSDVLQAENAVLSAEVNIVKTKSQLEDALRLLSELIGYSEGAPIEITALSIDTFTPTALHKEDLWNRVLNSSYALKQLESVEVTYGINDIYYENQLKPDLDLTASAATEGDAEDFGASFGDVTDSQNYSLTLTYNLPWGKREIKNRIEQNAISRKELTEQRRQIVEALRTKYENLRREISTTISTLELMESNIAVAEENANILRERQRVGLGTTIDVLDGERQLLQAKLAYISAIADHLRSEYDLKVLAGMAP
jgi:outer membrane protein TolC